MGTQSKILKSKNMDTITTYELALRDVNTGSFPNRENGVLIFSNGQRILLNNNTYNPLRELHSKLNTLKAKKSELIDQILSKENLFGLTETKTDKMDKELENDINELSAKIEMLKTDIEDEEQRLEARGISLPVKPLFDENIDNNNENSKINKFQNLKKHWQPLKKWLGVFSIIVVLETFFGLALWDSLRDQKSIVQVILRIASSGALVITLHLAEIKYKEKRALIFGLYIVYGIISLVVLLFGSLILGYFFPESLNSGVSQNIFDLNNSASVVNENVNKDWIGFYLRYDFSIGLFGMIVYLLLSFLDRKKMPKNEEDINIINHNTTKSSVTAHLTRMYSSLSSEERKLATLKEQHNNLKNEPSHLLNEIHHLLKTTKESIEKIDNQISEIENKTESIFRDIELQLDKYRIDFLDIFKSKPASQFVQLEWPAREDIKKYYNIV